MTEKEKRIYVAPGEKIKTSGEYSVRKPYGGYTSVYLVKGAVAPPTPKRGQHWELVEATSDVRNGNHQLERPTSS